MARLIERVVETSVEHSQQVLIGIVALTLVVLTGFARADVDTDPARLVQPAASSESAAEGSVGPQPASEVDDLVVTIVGERSLLTSEVLTAIRSVAAEIAGLEGIDGSGVISVADVVGPRIPDSRQELNELSELIRADSALGGVVLSADRTVLTIVAPLADGETHPVDTADAVLASTLR